MPYDSPEEMLAQWVQKHRQHKTARQEAYDRLKQMREGEKQRPSPHHDSPVAFSFLASSFTSQPSPPLQESDQTPRQWNLMTLKRCVVTRAEFQHYGHVEAVLKKKGFPTQAPDDGSLLISWFDSKEHCAYYELCRVQDKGELLTYMHEQFVKDDPETMERMISL